MTGGAGSIGSEVVRQVIARGDEAWALDIDETRLYELERATGCGTWLGDVTLEHDVTAAFSAISPDAVVHAAAYKHVPMGERFKSVVRRVNVGGTRTLIEECQARGIRRFLLVSTDKVAGTSVMGASKREAERHTLKAGFSVIRLGNVLWSRGSVLPVLEREHLDGKPLSITHPEMRRYFISAEDAADRILSALELPPGLYAAEMGEQSRVIDVVMEAFPGSEWSIVGVRPGEAMAEGPVVGEPTGVRGVLRCASS